MRFFGRTLLAFGTIGTATSYAFAACMPTTPLEQGSAAQYPDPKSDGSKVYICGKGYCDSGWSLRIDTTPTQFQRVTCKNNSWKKETKKIEVCKSYYDQDLVQANVPNSHIYAYVVDDKTPYDSIDKLPMYNIDKICVKIACNDNFKISADRKSCVLSAPVESYNLTEKNIRTSISTRPQDARVAEEIKKIEAIAADDKKIEQQIRQQQAAKEATKIEAIAAADKKIEQKIIDKQTNPQGGTTLVAASTGTKYTGTVIEKPENEPAIAANVVCNGDNIGTVTDTSGKFEITCPAARTITVSGFYRKSVTISLSSNKTNLGTIYLEEKSDGTTSLKEAVAIGCTNDMRMAVHACSGDDCYTWSRTKNKCVPLSCDAGYQLQVGPTIVGTNGQAETYLGRDNISILQLTDNVCMPANGTVIVTAGIADPINVVVAPVDPNAVVSAGTTPEPAAAPAPAIDPEVLRQQQLESAQRSITSISGNLKNTFGGLGVSVWKNKDGGFNTARLASDSIAGVVLGTVGGVITSNIVKKNQLKGGFEDIKCLIGGQQVASYGDTFQVGIR